MTATGRWVVVRPYGKGKVVDVCNAQKRQYRSLRAASFVANWYSRVKSISTCAVKEGRVPLGMETTWLVCWETSKLLMLVTGYHGGTKLTHPTLMSHRQDLNDHSGPI